MFQRPHSFSPGKGFTMWVLARSQLPLNKQNKDRGGACSGQMPCSGNEKLHHKIEYIHVQMDLGQVVGYGSHRPLSSFDSYGTALGR